MNYFKQAAQIKADQIAEKIKNLCESNDVELSIDDDEIEVTAFVKDNDNVKWHAFSCIEKD